MENKISKKEFKTCIEDLIWIGENQLTRGMKEEIKGDRKYYIKGENIYHLNYIIKKKDNRMPIYIVRLEE